METAAIVGVAIGALLVGALLPLLVEARAVLRSTRSLVEAATPKVLATLDEAKGAAAHVNRIADALEPAAPRVAELAETAASLSASLERLKSGLELAATVGPAVMAAIKAFHAARAAHADAQDPNAHGDAQDTEEPTGARNRAAPHTGDPRSPGAEADV